MAGDDSSSIFICVVYHPCDAKLVYLVEVLLGRIEQNFKRLPMEAEVLDRKKPAGTRLLSRRPTDNNK